MRDRISNSTSQDGPVAVQIREKDLIYFRNFSLYYSEYKAKSQA